MGGGGCHGNGFTIRGSGRGAGAASDWLRGRAASSLRTCAVAPRRGHGGAGARWFRAGLPRTGLDGRLRPRLRALRDETWRAEAPLQRGTEPATQAQRQPPLLPGASRAAPQRVRRSGHRLGCGRPEGWGLQGGCKILWETPNLGGGQPGLDHWESQPEGVGFTQGSTGLVGVIRKRNRKAPCKGGDGFEQFKKFVDSLWYSRA